MKRITRADLEERIKPEACLGSEWDSYGCTFCGSRYHCASCGGSSNMMGHWIKVADFEGHWCTIARGPDHDVRSHIKDELDAVEAVVNNFSSLDHTKRIRKAVEVHDRLKRLRNQRAAMDDPTRNRFMKIVIRVLTEGFGTSLEEAKGMVENNAG